MASARAEATGEITPEFLDLARRLLPSNPVICDIGSRDAREGIALQDALGGSLHVFEANPSAIEVCRANLAGRANVHLHECAVSDREGELKFYPVSPNAGDIGFSSLFRINPDYMRNRTTFEQHEITVRSTTLASALTGERPHLLWIDVEGAELLVLRGAAELLTSVRLIHVEVSFRPMQVGKPLFWEIEAFLREKGFRLQGFSGIGPLKSFVYRHRLWPNLPWRMNAIFCR